MNVTNIAIDIIRVIVWLFCEMFFLIMDLCYGIVIEILTLNLFDFNFIWDWWKALLVFMFLFIVARLSFLYFKALYDEDTLDKLKPQEIIVRLFAIGFVLVLLPVFLEGLSSITSGMTTNLAGIIGIDGATTPSLMFKKAGGLGDGLVLDIININNKSGGKYLYFSGTIELFFVLITAGLGAMMFLFIGLQVTQRLFSMLLKILISPYAISDIVVENDNTFETWFKLFIADLLTAFFQVLLIFLVFTGINYVTQLSAIAKIVFFMGGLFTIMNAPQGIAQLLGGDIGTATAFQQMQSLTMLTSGISSALKLAGVAGSITTTLGAAGVYGASRSMGAESLSASAMAGMAMPNIGNSSSGSSSFGGSGNANGGLPSSGGNTPSYDSGGNSGTSGADTDSYGASSSNDNKSSYSGYTQNGSWLNQAGWKNNQTTVGRLANKGFQSLYKASANRVFSPKRDARGNIKNTLGGNAVRVRNAVRDARGGNNVQ